MSEKPANADIIDDLPQSEKIQLLYMTMSSIRGNWRNPQRRARMIVYLSEQIDDDAVGIDLGSVKSTARAFTGDETPDGRRFRRFYESMDISQDYETASKLATIIPDDMTWGEHRLEMIRDD